MTIVVDFLKWLNQCPNSRQALAMETMDFKHNLSLIMRLIWLYDSLSGLGTDELLQLTIAQTNSSSKKSGQVNKGNVSISFSTNSSISWNWAELKEEWRACQRLANSKQGFPLYLIVSIAGSLCLLTQFISSYSLLFLLAISWILRLKNSLFVFLMVFQNIFQLLILFKGL